MSVASDIGVEVATEPAEDRYSDEELLALAADGQLIPEALDRESLIALVNASVEAGVRLSFAGKANARTLTRKVRPRGQRSVPTQSIGSATEQARNVVVEGDNLQAMVTLYRERGQVDLILTDPPYNTGQDFRYNDRWDEDPNDPGLGELVSEEDAAKHTKWVRFMLPRLQMMKSMLKPGGVLAICIDHRELFHLGQMLDELFGEDNRLAIINWQKSYSPKSDKKHVSTATEYVLVYARSKDKTKTGLLPRTDAMDARYKSRDGDPWPWKSGDAGASGAATHQGMIYGIQSPFTGDMHYPTAGDCWRSDKQYMKAWLEAWGSQYKWKDIKDGERKAQVLGLTLKQAEDRGSPCLPNKALVLAVPLAEAKKRAMAIQSEGPWPRLYFGVNGLAGPALKIYLHEVKQGIVPTTWWSNEKFDDEALLGSVSWAHAESGHSQTGINELDAVVGKGHGFDTVKPLRLFEKIIQIWCPGDGLILDPFAGSGTSGHAVLKINQATGTQRRFILIEQGRPERRDTYARTLLAERLRRVVTGDLASGKQAPVPGGFRFVTLTNKVDADALLQMERVDMVDTVIASYFEAGRRRTTDLIRETSGYRYLVARNAEDEGFFLVWGGAGENTDLTEEVYEACSQEAKAASLKPVYHVYARLRLYQTENVRFYQIPDRILADFGLDLRSDPFVEVE
jgi:adenine-specific DNA-methyltransferase